MLPHSLLDETIDRALAEDLGSGDLTSTCCIDAEARASAAALARNAVVVCGGPLFARVFARVDAAVEVALDRVEGEWVAANTLLWRVEGRARSLLAAERVALNFVQRLSGVATLTRRFVDALPADSPTRIADTRKTTPGLRALERYAVRMGGGHNHRDNLASAVMIKDNHIAAAGSIERAVRLAVERASHLSRIEVEVTDLQELDEALAAGADVIMLDNMGVDEVRAAVERARAQRPHAVPVLEASGGIGPDQVAPLARAGVDVISIGALTHSAPAADIALEFAFDRRADP